jgi:hypothetical protein
VFGGGGLTAFCAVPGFVAAASGVTFESLCTELHDESIRNSKRLPERKMFLKDFIKNLLGLKILRISFQAL